MADSEENESGPPEAVTSPQPGLIDDLDRRIIGLLQEDGRASNTQIARALGLTEATIRKRVRRLMADGVLNIGAMPTARTVNRMSSVVIGLSIALDYARVAAERLAQCPAVSYVGLSTGRYDIIVEAFFQSHEELLAFITGDLAAIEGVRNVETSLILEIVKFKYEWEIP
jgi:Lrp/AsnC family transcriptional regulator for asnA, asnC and gidA